VRKPPLFSRLLVPCLVVFLAGHDLHAVTLFDVLDQARLKPVESSAINGNALVVPSWIAQFKQPHHKPRIVQRVIEDSRRVRQSRKNGSTLRYALIAITLPVLALHTALFGQSIEPLLSPESFEKGSAVLLAKASANSTSQIELIRALSEESTRQNTMAKNAAEAGNALAAKSHKEKARQLKTLWPALLQQPGIRSSLWVVFRKTPSESVMQETLMYLGQLYVLSGSDGSAVTLQDAYALLDALDRPSLAPMVGPLFSVIAPSFSSEIRVQLAKELIDRRFLTRAVGENAYDVHSGPVLVALSHGGVLARIASQLNEADLRVLLPSLPVLLEETGVDIYRTGDVLGTLAESSAPLMSEILDAIDSLNVDDIQSTGIFLEKAFTCIESAKRIPGAESFVLEQTLSRLLMKPAWQRGLYYFFLYQHTTESKRMAIPRLLQVPSAMILEQTARDGMLSMPDAIFEAMQRNNSIAEALIPLAKRISVSPEHKQRLAEITDSSNGSAFYAKSMTARVRDRLRNGTAIPDVSKLDPSSAAEALAAAFELTLLTSAKDGIKVKSFVEGQEFATMIEAEPNMPLTMRRNLVRLWATATTMEAIDNVNLGDEASGFIIATPQDPEEAKSVLEVFARHSHAFSGDLSGLVKPFLEQMIASNPGSVWELALKDIARSNDLLALAANPQETPAIREASLDLLIRAAAAEAKTKVEQDTEAEEKIEDAEVAAREEEEKVLEEIGAYPQLVEELVKQWGGNGIGRFAEPLLGLHSGAESALSSLQKMVSIFQLRWRPEILKAPGMEGRILFLLAHPETSIEAAKILTGHPALTSMELTPEAIRNLLAHPNEPATAYVLNRAKIPDGYPIPTNRVPAPNSRSIAAAA